MKATETIVRSIDPTLIGFLDDVSKSFADAGETDEVDWRDLPIDEEIMILLLATKRYGDRRAAESSGPL